MYLYIEPLAPAYCYITFHSTFRSFSLFFSPYLFLFHFLSLTLSNSLFLSLLLYLSLSSPVYAARITACYHFSLYDYLRFAIV